MAIYIYGKNELVSSCNSLAVECKSPMLLIQKVHPRIKSKVCSTQLHSWNIFPFFFFIFHPNFINTVVSALPGCMFSRSVSDSTISTTINLHIHLSTIGSGNKVSCNHYLMTRRRKIVIYCIHSGSTLRNNLWHPVEDKISHHLHRHGKDEKTPNTPAGIWLQIFQTTHHYFAEWGMAPFAGVQC